MMVGFLFPDFWDRWMTHGIQKKTVYELRQRINSLEDWITIIQKHANDYDQLAKRVLNQYLFSEAAYYYRITAMNMNLIQWIFPEIGYEKQQWYQRCKDMNQLADELEVDEIKNVIIQVERNHCYGRMRVPEQPRGCVIIVSPIDSSKEEFITFEEHFARNGFATISFDGPGQGETYIINQFKSTLHRWGLFMNEVIDFAASEFPRVPLHLFGISSGGSWAIQGSSHPKVSGAAVVSPLIDQDIKMPDYYKERLSYITDNDENTSVPNLQEFNQVSPILFFSGMKDDIAKTDRLYDLYNKLPLEKQLIEYEDEKHYCFNRMSDILDITADWYIQDAVKR
ncbi:alpha/beta hydrolase [Paenibacillus crassostreae]|nr:alpha/beta hydrolase [Paenibacillus crassostreae]